MDNDIRKLLIPPEIKAMLYTSLTQVLKPLTDQWDEAIDSNRQESPEYCAGLQRARDDLQAIIDAAEKRLSR